MKRIHKNAMGVCTGLVLSGVTFAAQPGWVDFGQRAFVASCASCHGVLGKGDGALREYLIKPPTDLTTLTGRNGGVFPAQRVRDTIDGRGNVDIGPHGVREMPVWGQVYRAEDTPPYALNARVRMAALVDFLARIQEK